MAAAAALVMRKALWLSGLCAAIPGEAALRHRPDAATPAQPSGRAASYPMLIAALRWAVFLQSVVNNAIKPLIL